MKGDEEGSKEGDDSENGTQSSASDKERSPKKAGMDGIDTEANDEEIKKKLEAQIEANEDVIEKMRLEFLNAKNDAQSDVSSEDCIPNSVVFTFMKHD